MKFPDSSAHTMVPMYPEKKPVTGPNRYPSDERRELPFQKAVLNRELPYTIGGGIGQSRICMFFLRKAHIGEVHASLWPEEVLRQAEEKGVKLL